MKRALTFLALSLLCTGLTAAEDPIFSGPQAGEKLSAITVQGVLGDLAGQKIEPLKVAGDKPLLLIFSCMK